MYCIHVQICDIKVDGEVVDQLSDPKFSIFLIIESEFFFSVFLNRIIDNITF